MTDIIGNELFIGDKVVYTKSGYEQLDVGYIDSFTPKGCRVSDGVSRLRYRSLKFSNQLVKVK